MITTDINPVPEVGASPGVSIYTCLLGPSPERVSIYDNWPLKECYTVREANVPKETRVMKIVKRLNILKDSSRSDKTTKTDEEIYCRVKGEQIGT